MDRRKRELPGALPALEVRGLAAFRDTALGGNASRDGPGQADTRDFTLKATGCFGGEWH